MREDRSAVSPIEAQHSAYMAEDLLTESEVARIARCSVSLLQKCRTAIPPRGPRFVRPFGRGGRVLYRFSDVMRWIERAVVATSDDPEPQPIRRIR